MQFILHDPRTDCFPHFFYFDLLCFYFDIYKEGKKMCDSQATIIICLMKINKHSNYIHTNIPLHVYFYYMPKKENITSIRLKSIKL